MGWNISYLSIQLGISSSQLTNSYVSALLWQRKWRIFDGENSKNTIMSDHLPKKYSLFPFPMNNGEPVGAMNGVSQLSIQMIPN